MAHPGLQVGFEIFRKCSVALLMLFEGAYSIGPLLCNRRKHLQLFGCYWRPFSRPLPAKTTASWLWNSLRLFKHSCDTPLSFTASSFSRGKKTISYGGARLKMNQALKCRPEVNDGDDGHPLIWTNNSALHMNRLS